MDTNQVAEKLESFARSLSIAVAENFMSREHAKNIFRALLKRAGIDVERISPPVQEEKKV